MFLHQSVSHSVHRGRHLLGRHPLGRHPVNKHPRGRHPLGSHPLGRHPGQVPASRQTPPPPNDHCSGRYASYSSAFLFKTYMLNLSCKSPTHRLCNPRQTTPLYILCCNSRWASAEDYFTMEFSLNETEIRLFQCIHWISWITAALIRVNSKIISLTCVLLALWQHPSL